MYIESGIERNGKIRRILYILNWKRIKNKGEIDRMRNNYLIIELENNREDFTDTWNIINAIKKNKIANLKDCKNIYYYNVLEEIGGEGKLIAQIDKERCKMLNATKEQICAECGICLWIKDKAENDIIEYQYLALILQNVEDVICYIYPDIEERIYEVYNEVSCYFSLFVQRHNRRKKIWINRRRGDDNGIEELRTELSNNSYKIIPLIEFEYKEWEEGKKNSVLENWTRTVGQFLQDCDADREIREMEPFQELSYRLSNAKKNLKNAEAKKDVSVKVLERRNKYNEEIKNLQRKRKRLEEIGRRNEDCRLLCQCLNYFVINPKSKNIDEMERYKLLFRNEDIQEILDDASFLAFFILCIQVHFMKNETTLDVDEIRMLLINAEELAEGIVQLLENLHHSSKKRGLFSIRIHEKMTEKNYLSAIYPDYSNEKDGSRYNFEFRVLDHSRYNIVESFKNSNEKSEQEIPNDFGVKDFFEGVGEDRFWEEYNRKPENLVHHYGLKIFSTIISNNGGRFRVVSSSKTNLNLKKECYYNGEGKFSRGKHIPGTEYDILLPMSYDVKPLNPSIDADIQYQFDMKKQFHVKLFDSMTAWQKVIEHDDGLVNGQSRKEKRIDGLADGIQEWLVKMEVNLGLNSEEVTDEIVTVISAKDWGGNRLEILCKALVLCLIKWKPQNSQGFNIIIKDCTPNDFISIARMFAIFYSKGILSNYMDRLQIYLSGMDQSEEFIIAGNNLNSLFTMASKLTLVRGIQQYCMKSIEYILRKFQMNDAEEHEMQELQLVPFDILELPSTKETLFEQAVKRVLESDIQRYSFGCKVRHTHMRIGSKLHISEFFEAELLFHNNYYVARFALLILRRLEKELQKDKSIMFVGYETYSELLLYEIVTNLNAKGFNSSYMIYEQRQEGTFRYYDSIQYLKEKENLVFILIVPINSSMTTHSKLQAWLYQEIEKAGLGRDICIAQQYAIILIRSSQEGEKLDDMEENYYASMQKGIVRASFLPEDRNTIQYFVCINTKWSDPLLCEFCFPPKSMLKERPLIETNRSSIIPIQMLGIQEKDILKLEEKSEEVKTYINEENQRRVYKLGEALIYKHIVRNGNHFIFYFELEKYFIQNRNEIINWLKGIKECKKKNIGIVYDVIVAPLHYSNAGFVAEVNYHLYGNAALVLNFEVDKEFRENVRTKYSNVIGLYKKLIDMGNPAELRFHFVDDNIITGNTFLRAKSLFASLLPGEHSKVKVKVFDDIIVLLNRMSEASIMNCVQDRKDYYAYVFLNISSMRNHEDACSLCKIVENSITLRDQSATNRMYKYWDEKIVYHQVKKPEEYRDLRDAETQQRAIRRMLCTHEINENLKYMGHLRNETDEVKKVMLHLMSARGNSEESIEWIISYIKIFSRPFVSFRKSCQEASFAIMLELIEFMARELCENDSKLRNSKFTKHGDLKALCCVIRDAVIKYKQGDKVFSLFLTLMQRLSVLGSNYVIRKENIVNLFSFVEIFIQKSYISEEKWQRFIHKYISIIKRIVCLSSDENKCIYLEHIILFGEEYGKGTGGNKIIESDPDREFVFSLPQKIAQHNGKEFVEVLFLENTRVLYDGIHDLNREMTAEISLDSLSKQLKNKYYFKNFKRLLTYYHFIDVREDEVTFTPGCAESVLAMVKVYRMLCETGEEQGERDVETFYNSFLEYVEVITKTNAQLLIPALPTDGGKIVYKKQRDMEIGREEIDYAREKFVYDTYAISESEDKKKKVLIKYKNYVGREFSEKEKNQMNEVYLELLFPCTTSQIQIMIAIKCIMIFRALIIKNLEKDFSNNLMQKWSAEQSFKKNMKLERASDHTDKDELAGALNLISKGMGNWEKEYQKTLFELVINSYIARFNVQLLAESYPEGENMECSFAYVYKKQLKSLLDVLHEIQDFKILDETGEERFSQKVLNSRIRMYENDRRYERLSIRRLSIIFVELVLSAIKYSDNQIIYIYREQNYLVAKNTFVSDKDIAVIKKEAHDSSSRKKEGISLAVIKELVDSFYLLDKENGVIIDAEEVEEKKFYLVKLPIFME